MTKKSEPEDPFAEAVTQYALSQMRAAQMRFRPADPNLEKPKDVTAAFFADFAHQLDGVVGPTKLAASRRELQINRGDLTHVFSFQASTHNTAGATIVLWPHASVQSKALRMWRRGKPHARTWGRGIEFPRPDNGLFVWGMLGNFLWPCRYIALELIDPGERLTLLEHTVSLCLEIDRRLRADLNDQNTFFAYATRPETEVVCFGADACEFIAASWGIEAVRDYACAAMRAIPDGEAIFHAHLAQVAANPNAKGSVGFRLDGIARFLLAHDITPP